MNKRTLTLLIAAILAIGAGLLAFDYLTSVNKTASAAPPRTVLVAASDIPAQTSITPALVHEVTRPSDSVDPNALSNADGVVGTMAMVAIPAGATLTSSNTGKPTTSPLPARLRRGMRAMSIPVDVVKSVAGLIAPGDYVDVVAVPPRVSSSTPKAYTIMRDVEVLAVGSALENAVASPAPPGVNVDPRTITLQVTPHQADLLAMADINTVLRLALRSSHDTGALPAAEELVFEKQAQPVGAPLQALGRAVDPPKSERPPSISPVTVIDGDTVVASGTKQ
ncbi:MAG: Flp pilus assembly protein CpaB [Candidatus Baltobacteraceae bacterium]